MNKLLLIPLFLFLQAVVWADSTIAIPEARCIAAKKLVDSGVTAELATLGDCSYFGANSKSRLNESVYWYTTAAIYGSDYGRLQAGTILLFESDSGWERALGRLMLTDLSSSDFASESRGWASYRLGVYLLKKGAVEQARRLIQKAVDKDGLLDGVYAAQYLFYEAGDKSVLFETRGPFSFRCWVDYQRNRLVDFPFDEAVLVEILAIAPSDGECP